MAVTTALVKSAFVQFVLVMIFLERGLVFHLVSKHEETDKSTRPTAGH